MNDGHIHYTRSTLSLDAEQQYAKIVVNLITSS
jgi:hypothetical protein